MTKSVLVPLANGFEEIEATTLIDVLRRANVEVTLASVMPSLQVTGAHHIQLLADVKITDCLTQTFDLIALPGGIPGAEFLRDSEPLTQLLQQQAASDRWIAAICAAPYVVLHHHGLLKQKRATGYPAYFEKMTDSQVINKPVVVDGHCITSQGPATAMIFALTLVEYLLGSQSSESLAKDLLFSDAPLVK